MLVRHRGTAHCAVAAAVPGVPPPVSLLSPPSSALRCRAGASRTCPPAAWPRCGETGQWRTHRAAHGSRPHADWVSSTARGTQYVDNTRHNASQERTTRLGTKTATTSRSQTRGNLPVV